MVECRQRVYTIVVSILSSINKKRYILQQVEKDVDLFFIFFLFFTFRKTIKKIRYEDI